MISGSSETTHTRYGRPAHSSDSARLLIKRVTIAEKLPATAKPTAHGDLKIAVTEALRFASFRVPSLVRPAISEFYAITYNDVAVAKKSDD
jgi:hypothetical protein